MATVLIVDDEEEICDVLKDMLVRMDLAVECATTGDLALQMIERNDWTMGLVDLKLSTSVTGVDVIKAFRKKNPYTMIIVITGYIDRDLKREVEGLRVNAYLEKPNGIQEEVLTDTVRSVLSKS